MRDRWRVLAALLDKSRRALYDYVRRQDHPVTREEAAEAGRLSRGLAAFHLDKLVDAGLLRARYQSPPDKRGRGRTPKVYEAVEDGLSITIPERRYEFIASVLADAVATDPGVARDAALREARDRGATLGARYRDGVPAAVLSEALADLGFEPESDGRRTLLHNCPFHALAERQRELVCELNLAFVSGLIDGFGTTEVRALLAPRPGGCCVELAAG